VWTGERILRRRGSRDDAQAALHDSRLRDRQIVETTSEGVWTLDADNRTTFVNARMEAMLGYETGEMAGRPLDDFVFEPPDLVGKLERRRSGVVEQHETRLRRRDGSALWVSISSDALPSPDGAYAGVLAMVSDISNRRRADGLLQDAHARFEGAFEHAPIGMALVSLEGASLGQILRVNSAVCRLLGYGECELVGRTIGDITHPDDRAASVAFTRALVAGEAGPSQIDKRYLTASGSVVLATLSASVVPGRDGAPGYAIAQIQDVTARRLAEEQVAGSERRLRAVFSLALDAMLIADDDRNLLDGNRAAGELLGLEPGEIAGKRLDDYARGDPEDTEALWARFLLDGEMKGEFELQRADGEIRHVEFSARANIQPGRHLSILRDITDRKRATAARERARLEAEQLRAALDQAHKLETVGQLAGGVAHDFNNLLAVIIHSAEFALADLEGHPAADEVREIRSTADRAAALIRQLLVFSRREVTQPRLLDLNASVTTIERLLRRTIGEHIALEAVLDASAPVVHVDPNHVEQALLNLAVNARDAMPGGGTLRVATGTAQLDDALARRRGVLPGRYAVIAVTDTGSGMTPAVRERAFEPFYTTKSKGAGTGLGLATTYGIVKQNGGDIEIASTPGAGTVVTIYLPAAAGRALPGDQDEPPCARRGGGERILLVEDEAGVRRSTERILREHGYEVTAAAGPEEALVLAADADADLILTDIVMPGMPGTLLVDQLQRHRPRLPAIFMSGYTDRRDALPRDGIFLGKPFSRRQLLETVERALKPGLPGRI
jgi:two-component system cell cycle sensor histidine kinase/response regulator CckA